MLQQFEKVTKRSREVENENQKLKAECETLNVSYFEEQQKNKQLKSQRSKRESVPTRAQSSLSAALPPLDIHEDELNNDVDAQPFVPDRHTKLLSMVIDDMGEVSNLVNDLGVKNKEIKDLRE